MPIDRVNDLRAFKGFIEEKLSSGSGDLTVDQALALWEIANETDEERERTITAIRRGMADVDAGRTRPIEEFDREFRAQRGLPPRT